MIPHIRNWEVIRTLLVKQLWHNKQMIGVNLHSVRQTNETKIIYWAALVFIHSVLKEYANPGNPEFLLHLIHAGVRSAEQGAYTSVLNSVPFMKQGQHLPLDIYRINIMWQVMFHAETMGAEIKPHLDHIISKIRFLANFFQSKHDKLFKSYLYLL